MFLSLDVLHLGLFLFRDLLLKIPALKSKLIFQRWIILYPLQFFESGNVVSLNVFKESVTVLELAMQDGQTMLRIYFHSNGRRCRPTLLI